MQAFTKPLLDAEYIRKSEILGEKAFCLLGLYLGAEDHTKGLDNMRIPKVLRELAEVVNRLYHVCQQKKQDTESLLNQFYAWDVFRRPQRFTEAIEILKRIESKEKICRKFIIGKQW